MKTLALGEVLWDIVEDKKLLGGAPFNVAAHLAKMGVESYLVSAVGKDDLGQKILETAGKLHVNTEFTHISKKKPTGTVDVFLQDGQPDYAIIEDVAWDEIRLSRSQFDQIVNQSWDCIIFGSLAQRGENNRELFRKLLANINSNEIFLDINLRKNYFSKEILHDSIEKVTILKLNGEEVKTVSSTLFDEILSNDSFANRIREIYNVQVICVTLGEKGALIYGPNKIIVPGVPTKVQDTIGAGDSFSAAFIHTYLEKSDLTLAGKMGCMLGAYVASRSGAIPEYSEEVKQELRI